MLVRPFIQTIDAFDVSQSNGEAIVSILGGNTIEKINYEIYSSGGVAVYSGVLNVTDGGGVQVRNFSIPLTASMTLANNNSYSIRAYTQNVTSDETSGFSSMQYFTCYATPTITLKDSNNTTIAQNYQFTSQSGTITATLTNPSPGSPALLNDISIKIYGLNSNGQNLVYASDVTYTPFQLHFDNLTPTVLSDSLYLSYALTWEAHTVQNMELRGTITLLSCNYTITESGSFISVANECANGRIKVEYDCGAFTDLTSLMPPASSPQRERLICAIAPDGDNIYLAGGDNFFAVYDKIGGAVSTISAPFSADTTIRSMVVTEQKVYLGSDETKLAIYDKTAGTYTTITTNIPDVVFAMAMDTDGNNLYFAGEDLSVVGGNTVGTPKFGYFDISNNQIHPITFPPAISTQAIRSIVVDNDNVYLGCDNGKFAIYDKKQEAISNIPTSFETYAINALAIDNDNVYLGGDYGSFAIYNKNAVATSALIDNPFSHETTFPYSIFGMASVGDKVYIGVSADLSSGKGYKFAIYNKSVAKFGTELTSPIGATYAVVADGDTIYCGGNNGVTRESFARFDPLMYLRRREVLPNPTEWNTLLTESYGGASLSFYDYYTKTDTLYEYQIAIGGRVESVQVISQFDGAYIADGATAYEIGEEWEISNAQRVQKSAIYEPYGRQYPVIAYNALTNYRSGTDTAILRADVNRNNRENNYLDRISQTRILNEFNDFLTNRKVKVLKDYNGDIVIINVIETVPNGYFKELGNGLATTQFSWVEVGGFKDKDFKQLGITNRFKILEFGQDTLNLSVIDTSANSNIVNIPENTGGGSEPSTPTPSESQTYTVTLVANDANYGTISTATITNVLAGSTILVESNTVTIGGTTATATVANSTAQYSYGFSSWSVANGTIVTGNMTITANFTRTTNKYTVTIVSNNTTYGTVDVGSISNVDYGTAVSVASNTLTIDGTVVTATPRTVTGYTTSFSSWSVSNGSTISANTTITATFSARFDGGGQQT